MATVSIVYRKDKLNKNNEAPINFYIIKDRKLTKIATGIKVHIDFWDFTKNKVKSKHPNSSRINSQLQNKFTELQDSVFEHETLSKSLTGRKLKELTYGKKPSDFFAFAQTILDEYLRNNQIGTHDKNKAVMTKLRTFLKGKSITFNDIDQAFLIKYEHYLKDELNNKINTVQKDFKFFRHVFAEAYNQDIIEHNVNPFNKYKIKSEKTERCYLTEEELSWLERLPLPKDSRQESHRDMFVFAAYTGGIRVGDLLKLRWSNFDGSHIHFTMRKTRGQLAIWIPDPAMEILKKYQAKATSPNAFIFEALPADLDMNDIRKVDRARRLARGPQRR